MAGRPATPAPEVPAESAPTAESAPAAAGNVYERVNAVMGEVQSISKDSRNSTQGFNFRGVDAVMNTVGPLLRKHGLIVTPTEASVTSSVVTTAKGVPMNRVVVEVSYRWLAPDGTSFASGAAGEAFDSGDKATPKAMSVAFRTMLLQALCVPTDDPDPDSESYVMGAAETVSAAVRAAATRAPSAEHVAEQVTQGLTALREIASEKDDSARIMKVSEWKQRAGAMGLLEQVTILQSGEKITLAALADKVATSALVTAPAEEAPAETLTGDE